MKGIHKHLILRIIRAEILVQSPVHAAWEEVQVNLLSVVQTLSFVCFYRIDRVVSLEVQDRLEQVCTADWDFVGSLI